ncbi:MAG: hypothetical protein RBU29_06455 [bacterium]|jgi:hypothetical protein|nr:hypothetical protein [bacterium]
MNSTLATHAMEVIRQALVREFVRAHPQWRAQDIVMTSRDGRLVLTPLPVLTEDKERLKAYLHAIPMTTFLFRKLAIHRDPYWQDGVVSADHTRRLADSLHSSNFEALDVAEWIEKSQDIQYGLDACALTTVRLFQSKTQLRKTKVAPVSEGETRRLIEILAYLKLAIDQLNRVHALYRQESDLGELFSNKSKELLHLSFPPIQSFGKPPEFAKLLQQFIQTKDPQTGASPERREQILRINIQILLKTRKLLHHQLTQYKDQLTERRTAYEEVWSTISQLQNQPLPPKMDEESPLLDSKPATRTRMVRFKRPGKK